MPGVLAAADVALMINLVVPGAENAMPNKFFDYLAASLPILSNTPADSRGTTCARRRRDCSSMSELP